MPATFERLDDVYSNETHPIEVDLRGHAWVQGVQHSEKSFTDFLAVFEPLLDGSLWEVVRYTPENSNYQDSTFSTQLQLGSDGRMWVADNGLVWIDSNALNLERPLPDWVVAVTRKEMELVWVLVMWVCAMVYLVFIFQARRRMDQR